MSTRCDDTDLNDAAWAWIAPFEESVDELNWAPQHVNDSLATVYRHLIRRAEQAVEWYFRKKQVVARAGYILRLCAILSISIGAAGPLISNVWSLDVRPFSAPLSATLFAVAATCIGIDRALGLSSRHMRFVSAAFDIQRQIVGFRFSWHEKLPDSGAHPTTAENVRSLLHMAIALEESVWNIVQNETAEGRVESEKSLAALQAQARFSFHA